MTRGCFFSSSEKTRKIIFLFGFLSSIYWKDGVHWLWPWGVLWLHAVRRLFNGFDPAKKFFRVRWNLLSYFESCTCADLQKKLIVFWEMCWKNAQYLFEYYAHLAHIGTAERIWLLDVQFSNIILFSLLRSTLVLGAAIGSDFLSILANR